MSMLKYHCWAADQSDAIEKARNQYPHLQTGAAYLDAAWGKHPNRWCVEVGRPSNGDAAEAARQSSDCGGYLRDTGDAA